MEDQVLGPETVDPKRAFKSDKTGIRAMCSNYKQYIVQERNDLKWLICV